MVSLCAKAPAARGLPLDWRLLSTDAALMVSLCAKTPVGVV